MDLIGKASIEDRLVVIWQNLRNLTFRIFPSLRDNDGARMGPGTYILYVHIATERQISCKETDQTHTNLPDMFPTSLSEAVSTSNHLIQEIVTIETDVNIVWTMEVRGGGD